MRQARHISAHIVLPMLAAICLFPDTRPAVAADDAPLRGPDHESGEISSGPSGSADEEFEQVDDSEGLPPETPRLRISGYLKSLTSYTRLDSRWPWPDKGLLDNFSRVRIKLEGDFTPELSLVIHYENYAVWGDSVAYSTGAEDRPELIPPIFTLFGRRVPTLIDLEREYHRSNNVFAAHGLDRLYLQWRPGPLEVTLGRQEVLWGAGYLWSPLDLFAPFAPAQIDKEEKNGVDMARVMWTIKEGGELTALYAPKRNPATGDVDSALASTGIHYERDGDHGAISVLAADHRQHLVAGAAGHRFFQGRYTLRGEVTHTLIDESLGSAYGSQTQAVAGLDRWFGEETFLALEVYYNSIGVKDTDRYLDLLLDPYFQELISFGETFNVGRNYAAFIFDHDRTSVKYPWEVLFFTILNINDGSVLLAPRFELTIPGDMELTLGADLPFGSDHSEYGSYTVFDGRDPEDAPLPYPPQYYFTIKWTF